MIGEIFDVVVVLFCELCEGEGVDVCVVVDFVLYYAKFRGVEYVESFVVGDARCVWSG